MSSLLLEKAIEDRTVISFAYEGSNYSVEPYSIGFDESEPRPGPLLLRGWCLDVDGWRDFKVKHTSRIELTGVRFAGDRSGHASLLWVIRDVFGRSDGIS